MLNEKKAEIRRLIKGYFKDPANINKIKQEEDLQNSKDYCSSFLNKIPAYEACKTVFAYNPISEEFPTLGLLKQAKADKKAIALPLVCGKELVFKKIEFKNGKLEPLELGAYGIMEPAKKALNLFPQKEEERLLCPLNFPLLILVPGRAFSKNGERMGRGGGFYDRFFEKLFKSTKKEEICLAGLCFSGQIMDFIPTDKFDYPVDIVITEKDVFYRPK